MRAGHVRNHPPHACRGERALTVREFAPCKINLTLDVFARRADGFHDLDSIVVQVSPTDLLTVTVEPTFAAGEPFSEKPISLTCTDSTLPTDGRNLAFRAAQVFLDRFVRHGGHHVSMHLDKRLPHQAGLGGGSSDAAAVLRALAGFFGVATADLMSAATEIGSDVPLFLLDDPVRMRGRGEVIESLPRALPDIHGVIVKPPTGIATAWAYGRLDALSGRVPGDAAARLVSALESGDRMRVEELSGYLANDFEAAVLPANSDIRDAADGLRAAGALRALLCGSGSAVFGLARDSAHAQRIAFELGDTYDYVQVAAPYRRSLGDT